MRDWKSWVVPRLGQRPPRLAAGLYHYQRESTDGFARYHLRVEPNGEALLLANAAEAVRLSASAAPIAKALLERQPNDEPPAWRDIDSELVAEVERLLATLGRPSGRFPVFNLSDPLETARDAELCAPFQADVVVSSSLAARPLVAALWRAGIPHLRLLPDPALPTEELQLVIEQAEDLGAITGVRAVATWLLEPDRLERLAEQGLDYVVFPWGGSAVRHQRIFAEAGWDTLTAVSDLVREYEMTPVVEVALSTEMVDGLDEQLSHLLEFGLPHLEVFAVAAAEPDDNAFAGATDAPLPAFALRQVAAWIEEIADSHPWQVIWLPPVECRVSDQFATAVRQGPRAGGDMSIRVEANGDVLPPRGPASAVGNLLQDSWSKIWRDDAFRRFRQRVEANTRCEQCPGMAICAADCPAEPEGWARND